VASDPSLNDELVGFLDGDLKSWSLRVNLVPSEVNWHKSLETKTLRRQVNLVDLLTIPSHIPELARAYTCPRQNGVRGCEKVHEVHRQIANSC
jgi:hypothetical protein